MKSDAERKEQLMARLKELDHRLHDIEDELDQPVPKDFEERSVEREGDEVLESMGLAGQEEIRAINAALDRMEEGEYGYCVSCGDRISEERLDVVPYTPFCRKHAGGDHAV